MEPKRWPRGHSLFAALTLRLLRCQRQRSSLRPVAGRTFSLGKMGPGRALTPLMAPGPRLVAPDRGRSVENLRSIWEIRVQTGLFSQPFRDGQSTQSEGGFRTQPFMRIPAMRR